MTYAIIQTIGMLIGCFIGAWIAHRYMDHLNRFEAAWYAWWKKLLRIRRHND